jgi:hypothetical protein
MFKLVLVFLLTGSQLGELKANLAGQDGSSL